MSTRKVMGAAALLIALAGAGWIYAQAGKPTKLTASDYSEIQELYGNYTQTLDLFDPETLAGVFTEDGELISSGGMSFKGHEALLQMERDHGNSGTRHLTSDLVIKQAPDGVKATCYLVLINTRNSPPALSFTGLFDATVVKTPAGWKFKKLRVWRDNDQKTPFKATKKRGGGGPG
jgi:hypothetical protein